MNNGDNNGKSSHSVCRMTKSMDKAHTNIPCKLVIARIWVNHCTQTWICARDKKECETDRQTNIKMRAADNRAKKRGVHTSNKLQIRSSICPKHAMHFISILNWILIQLWIHIDVNINHLPLLTIYFEMRSFLFCKYHNGHANGDGIRFSPQCIDPICKVIKLIKR